MRRPRIARVPRAPRIRSPAPRPGRAPHLAPGPDPPRTPAVPAAAGTATRSWLPAPSGYVVVLRAGHAGTACANAAALPLVGSGGTTYSADFTEAAGLTPGDTVRVAGVKVGQGHRGLRWTGAQGQGLLRGRPHLDRQRQHRRHRHQHAARALATSTSPSTRSSDANRRTRPSAYPATAPPPRTTSLQGVQRSRPDLRRDRHPAARGELPGHLSTPSRTPRTRCAQRLHRPVVAVAVRSPAATLELADLLAGQQASSPRRWPTRTPSFQTLISDGNLLLGEGSSSGRVPRSTRCSIGTSSNSASLQLTGLVAGHRPAARPDAGPRCPGWSRRTAQANRRTAWT